MIDSSFSTRALSSDFVSPAARTSGTSSVGVQPGVPSAEMTQPKAAGLGAVRGACGLGGSRLKASTLPIPPQRDRKDTASTEPCQRANLLPQAPGIRRQVTDPCCTW
jgi:hypothetical protein